MSRYGVNRGRTHISRRERLMYTPSVSQYLYHRLPPDHILYDRLNYVAPVKVVEKVLQDYKIRFKDDRVVFPFFRYWDDKDSNIKDEYDTKSILACQLDKKLRYGLYKHVGWFGNMFGDHLVPELSPSNSVVGVLNRPVDALIMQAYFDHSLSQTDTYRDLIGGAKSVRFMAFMVEETQGSSSIIPAY